MRLWQEVDHNELQDISNFPGAAALSYSMQNPYYSVEAVGAGVTQVPRPKSQPFSLITQDKPPILKACSD